MLETEFSFSLSQVLYFPAKYWNISRRGLSKEHQIQVRWELACKYSSYLDGKVKRKLRKLNLSIPNI